MFTSKNIYIYLTVMCILGLGFFRIYGFQTNMVPLGYDPGIYRNMFLEYYSLLPHIDFALLNQYNFSSFPPFIGFWGNIMQMTGYSADFLLKYGIGILSVFTSLSLYIFLKPQNKSIAIFAAIIFLTSVIQYQVFWWGYYKQIFGIIFMIVALSMFQREKFVLAGVLSIATCTVHRPMGVFLIILVLLFMQLSYVKSSNIPYKKYFLYGGISSALIIIAYIPFWNSQILPLILPTLTTIVTEGKSGTFFDQAGFGKLNFLIILLSIIGLYHKLKTKDFDIYFSGYLVGAVWVGSGFLFYNRMLIAYDIFIIILAAFGAAYMYNSKNILLKNTVIGITTLQGLYYFGYVYNHHTPLISEQELEGIQVLDTITRKNDRVMVSDSSYSPWLHGYTKNSVIAPGLFESNKWDIEEWKDWWFGDSEKKCGMIQDYALENSHIYWWIGEKQPTFKEQTGECFELVLKNKSYRVYKITFDNENI